MRLPFSEVCNSFPVSKNVSSSNNVLFSFPFCVIKEYTKEDDMKKCEIFKIENSKIDFITHEKLKGIERIAKGYFDMTPLNNEFTYTDGNHLHKSSSKIVSEKIARWIDSK